MKDFESIRYMVGMVAILVVLMFALMKLFKKSKRITTKFIGRTAVFAAIATILYITPIFTFSVPFFPPFLAIHFDEIPAAIAGFAYGPISGLAVLLIKTVIKLPMTSTLGVGELADLLYGAILILPGAIIYRKMHNFKGVLVGLSIGLILQIIASAFFTTFVLLDFYMAVMGLKYETILFLCQQANANIKDLTWGFFWYVGIPFNAFKNIIIVVLTMVLYKHIHRLVDRISFQSERE